MAVQGSKMHPRRRSSAISALFLLSIGLGAQTPKYSVSYPDSFLLAVTGKSGMLSFAGHEHAVLATGWQASLTLDPQRLERSSLTITVPVSSLVIDSAEARQRAGLQSGPSPEDVKKIQARMVGPEVLDTSRTPTIKFTTVSIHENGPGQLNVTGQFELHGLTRQVTLPVRYRRDEKGAYVLSGDLSIRQTNFGLTPETAGHGTVKVKDEVRIRFQISAVPGS